MHTPTDYLYAIVDAQQKLMQPLNSAAAIGLQFFASNSGKFMPEGARAVGAMCDMLEAATRRYGKPDWHINEVTVDDVIYPVAVEETTFKRPFCNMLHFRKVGFRGNQSRVLIVAPMSGHFATLLRNTVEAMLLEHDVYITDWLDARDVPVSDGKFDLDDYTDYVIDMCEWFYDRYEERINILAVCQPGVPVMVGAALMSARHYDFRPATITLMGSPIDTRVNRTVPNELADKHPCDWFE
jgi:poly(3-hydroxybutyrate) depolymerase